MRKHDITYTQREMESTLSVGKAIDTAAMLCKGIPICINAVRRRRLSNDRLLNYPEFNSLVEELVDDSRFYRI